MVTKNLDLKFPFETKTIEFKQILNDGDKSESWLKSVVAFSNTNGGHLFVGVKDNGEAIGLPKELVNEQVQVFHRNVKEHISPLPKYEFNYQEIKKDLFVIDIKIDKAMDLPVILMFHGVPSIYIREEGRNIPAQREDIVYLVLSSHSDSFDNRLSNEKFDKNDFNILFDTFKNKKGYQLNEKILISNNFMNEEGVLKTGALLFKDDYSENETTIKITKWFGFTKGDNAYKNLLDLRENIISSINKSLDVIRENIGSYEKKEDIGRITIYDFPLRSVFEGIVNAFAHKNYFFRDSLIEVDIFKDRMEIASPGGLTTNINLNKEKNIDNIKPTRRNEVIANILTMCHFMEKEGSGFDKISQDYKLMDENHKPYVTAKENYFILTLPNINYSFNKDSENPDITCMGEELLSEKQLKVLSYCYNKARTAEEIAKFLNISLSTYFRKKILLPLVETNFLKRNDRFKADLYYSNRDIVKLK